MEMTVTFPANKRVHAEFDDFTVETDQSVPRGGEGSAPSPFNLFLASIGTCAGFYALRFMQERNIDTQGALVRMTAGRDPETQMVTKISVEIQLPPGFPEKYRAAIVRAVDQCTVKRHLLQPPAFEVMTRPAE